MAASHAAEGGTGTGAAGAAKRTGTGAAVGGGACTGVMDAAKRTGASGTVGGGARTGTSAGAASAETSLTPAASSSAIVLGDQPVNATGMVAGAGMGAGT